MSSLGTRCIPETSPRFGEIIWYLRACIDLATVIAILVEPLVFVKVALSYYTDRLGWDNLVLNESPT